MMQPALKHLLMLLLLICFSGCAASTYTQFQNKTKRPETAEWFFAHLDQAIETENVDNRGVTDIPGFPYLAGNRFLAAVKDQLTSPEGFQAWLAELYDLSLDARYKEVQNLPMAAVQELYQTGIIGQPGREHLWRQIQNQSALLLAHDQGRQDFHKAVLEAMAVPDDYETALRILGVYPLAALPVAYFSGRFFDQLRTWQKTSPAELAVSGQLKTYHFPERPVNGGQRVREFFSRAGHDPLGLPVLTDEARQLLTRWYAPVIAQDSIGRYDRIGRIYWDEKVLPAVDGEDPVVYTYFSPGFFKGKPVWQINYVFWYSGRQGKNVPWLERGRTDGITLRVSLDNRGDPFMVDLMNNCGCSHQFFPQQVRVSGIRKLPMMFDALVPAWLPEGFPDQPLRIRVNSGWHQVQSISAGSKGMDRLAYRLLTYNELESLPFDEGRNRSLFDGQGIVPGSERIEPFFLFSMGIQKIGAMRQRGHHPIALIGRAHFDDPHLFDRNFEWK